MNKYFERTIIIYLSAVMLCCVDLTGKFLVSFMFVFDVPEDFEETKFFYYS